MDPTDIINNENSLIALILGAISYILFASTIQQAVAQFSIGAKLMLMSLALLAFLVAFSSIESDSE